MSKRAIVICERSQPSLLFIAGQEYSTHLERLNGMADAGQSSNTALSKTRVPTYPLDLLPTSYMDHGVHTLTAAR